MLLVVVLSISLPYYVESTCPNIISRAEWEAEPQNGTIRLRVNPATYIVIHHTSTPLCNTVKTCKSQVKSIQIDHMMKPDVRNFDITYNFLIGGDGYVYEGRGWGLIGNHMKGYINSKSFGIGLIGEFHRQRPSSVQLDNLKKLIACAEQLEGRLNSSYRLIAHHQGFIKNCPGDILLNEISTYPHFTADVEP